MNIWVRGCKVIREMSLLRLYTMDKNMRKNKKHSME